MGAARDNERVRARRTGSRPRPIGDQWNFTYSKSIGLSFTPCCGGAM